MDAVSTGSRVWKRCSLAICGWREIAETFPQSSFGPRGSCAHVTGTKWTLCSRMNNPPRTFLLGYPCIHYAKRRFMKRIVVTVDTKLDEQKHVRHHQPVVSHWGSALCPEVSLTESVKWDNKMCFNSCECVRVYLKWRSDGQECVTGPVNLPDSITHMHTHIHADALETMRGKLHSCSFSFSFFWVDYVALPCLSIQSDFKSVRQKKLQNPGRHKSVSQLVCQKPYCSLSLPLVISGTRD